MTPTTLTEVSEIYDAFLVDQFGVILGGDGPYPGARAALEFLHAAGKPVFVLSNSGKRAAANETRLDGLGIPRTLYGGVVSSGEAAFHILSDLIGIDIPRRTRTLVLSRDETVDPIADLDLVRTHTVMDAGLVLITGSQGDQMSLDTYADILRPAADRNLPCYCTNPDMTMLTADGVAFAAGRIARLYEELGGSVIYIGKPHKAIYDVARQKLGGMPADRILCIGDSPDHDIAGGKAAGHATALVRTGIHADDDLDKILDHCRHKDILPDHILPAFRT